LSQNNQDNSLSPSRGKEREYDIQAMCVVWFFDVNYETFNIIVISVFKGKLYNPHVSIRGLGGI
jgi:hypothetical protein